MNSKGHLIISTIKSCIRIASCIITLFNHNIAYLAIGFGIAELSGIIEELVDKR